MQLPSFSGAKLPLQIKLSVCPYVRLFVEVYETFCFFRRSSISISDLFWTCLIYNDPTWVRKLVEGPSVADSANWVQGCFSRVQNANGMAETRRTLFWRLVLKRLSQQYALIYKEAFYATVLCR